jgi:lysophospholipase L1-like esterase
MADSNRALINERRSPRRGLRVLLAVVSLLLSIGTAEIALRLGGYSHTILNPLGGFHQSDPVFGYRGRPNFAAHFRKPEFDVVIAHDDRGFRKHETRPPADAAAPTVHCFGDSFTWGWGVAQGDVYTDVLARRLPNYRVVNWGLNASGTVQQYAIFRQNVWPNLKADDVVLVAFYQNDFNDNVAGHMPTRFESGRPVTGRVEQLPGGAIRAAMDVSCLANLLVYSWGVVSQRLAQHKSASKMASTDRISRQSDEYRVAQHFLREFQSACAERHARFACIYIPGQAELDEAADPDATKHQRDARFRATFLEITRRSGIDMIDLLPEFVAARKLGRCSRLTFEHDAHWNTAGHRCVADALEKKIEALSKIAGRDGTHWQ